MSNACKTLLAAALAVAASACANTGSQAATQLAPAQLPVSHAFDAPPAWGPCPPIFPSGCQIGVLHGDPSAPNADIFLRVPAGLGLPAHTHTSAERIILVSGELQVKYLGTPAVTLKPGSYAYGPADHPHQATCTSSETCTLFIAFEGPVDAMLFEGVVE